MRPVWLSLHWLRSKRWLMVGVELLLVAAVVFGAGAYQTRKHLKGRVAPDFELVDLSGQRVKLRDFRHRKVLLHFFATWCGVCRLELPSLKGLQAHLGSREALVAIVEDSSDVEAVRRYAREHELTYPILLGSPEVLRAYRVGAFPTNYYLDGDGTISGSTVGLSTRIGMSARLWLADAD